MAVKQTIYLGVILIPAGPVRALLRRCCRSCRGRNRHRDKRFYQLFCLAASINGVVGMKPTVGLISRSGIIPIAASQDTAGALGSSVKIVARAR